MNIEREADQVLKHLWQEYRSTGKRIWGLNDLGEAAEFCHVGSPNIDKVVRLLEGTGLITYRTQMHRVVGGAGQTVTIELTDKGIEYAEGRFGHWFDKARISFKTHPEYWIPSIIVAIAGIVVALILTLT